MANELRAHGRTGYTHYTQIFDETNQVWNGSAFVALSGATWTATAVTMTETPSGSGIFLGTFPAGIVTEGQYRWSTYERQTGSALNTDPLVWEDTVAWTGAAIYDITDIPTAAEIAAAVPTAAQNAAALLDLSNGIETGVTFRQAMRVITAAVAGVLSGAGTATVICKSAGGSTTRITATVDDSGNRSAVTLSAS